MVFECDAYNSVRVWFAPLFAVSGGVDDVGRVIGPAAVDSAVMCAFMAQKPRQVAAFIHECFVWRSQADRLPPYVPAAHLLDTFSSSMSSVTDSIPVGEEVSSVINPMSQ